MVVCAVVRTQSLVRYGIIAWEQGLLEYASVVLRMDERDALKNIDLIVGYAESVEILAFHSSFYEGYLMSLPVFEKILAPRIKE
jgi:hypothetical protein